jgi:hypothetical protein
VTAQTRDLVVERDPIRHRRIDHHAWHGALKPRDGAALFFHALGVRAAI